MIALSDIDQLTQDAGDNQALKDALLRLKSDLTNIAYMDAAAQALAKHRQPIAVGFSIAGASARETVLLAQTAFPDGSFSEDHGEFSFEILTQETPKHAARLTQDLNRLRRELTDWLQKRNARASLYRREGLNRYQLHDLTEVTAGTCEGDHEDIDQCVDKNY